MQKKGYGKVIMPKGEYCISENNPIIMVNNIILDLNGSTFSINTNGIQKYTIINFTGCKNATLINGTLLGDRYTHDYKTMKGSHEWDCGVVFNDSEQCRLDKVTVKGFPGYGVSSSLGKNISNLVIGVTKSNLAIGNISDKGVSNKSTGTIRTIKPMDISKVDGEFELGYNKGYMGYPYMSAKEYDAYFYDKDMKYISSSKGCKQYKKVSIPKGANFVHFVFSQGTVPSSGDTDFNGTTVFLTNYNSPYKIKITNCLIEDNRSLGMGLCGGRDFLIQGNTFKNNKGGAPGYAIDLEDGWEYMDKYVIKDNKFIGNANDVVICAGDNITFSGNEFSSTVYMWGRATNYKFTNNKFENSKQNINYECSTNTVCRGNKYTNCKIVISSKNANNKITFENEDLNNTSINTMSKGAELKDSKIVSDSNTSIRIAGTYRNCSINSKKGDFISAKFYNCKIESTNLNCQGDTVFKDCKFNSSSFGTTTNTKKITVSNSTLINCGFIVNTWGSPVLACIQDSEINMLSSNNSFINISAGKIANLIFKNNTVINKIGNPVFKLYDTGYSVPKGNANIADNNFTLTKYGYVFDGVKITSGTFSFNDKNNKIQGAKILSPQYINNKYFSINNK